MSPRAAVRLEGLGFERVYDYPAGKKDWGSYGLPRAGMRAEEPSAGDLARRDVPTAGLADRLQDVRARIGDWDTCIVVNADRIVLGRLGLKALGSDEDISVEEAMSPGPSTVRPSLGVAAALERMEKKGLRTLLVTTPDGRLVGVLYRKDVEKFLLTRP